MYDRLFWDGSTRNPPHPVVKELLELPLLQKMPPIFSSQG